MPVSPRRYFKTLASLSRLRLLYQVQTRGSLTVDELAAAMGLSRNTVREHLQRLVEVGLVRTEPMLGGVRGRPRLLYGTATGRSGPSDGQECQLGVLGDHLHQCGFDATIEPEAQRVTMRDCPFARLSEKTPEVCRVHLALIEGALRCVDGPVRAGQLHRFSSARECTLELVADAGTRETEHKK